MGSIRIWLGIRADKGRIKHLIKLNVTSACLDVAMPGVAMYGFFFFTREDMLSSLQRFSDSEDSTKSIVPYDNPFIFIAIM